MSAEALRAQKEEEEGTAQKLGSVFRGGEVSIRGNVAALDEANVKLIKTFGASSISELVKVPDFYTFKNELIVSHRDFDKYYSRLLSGEKSAIVSGLNPSATIHIGHIPVFDTNLFFQQKHGVEVFIPFSDDESYVSLKIKTQEEGLRYALQLTRSMLAYGFDVKKTHVIIDQIYTDIYNLAIKLSRSITMSEVKSVYSYTNDQNTGLHFYPAIQSAHVVLPNQFGMSNVLVPIGPDEDAHLRICRDIANRFKYDKPAVLHSRFLPGVDGEKMSKSRGNAVFFLDPAKEVKRKIMSAFSGGRETVEEHRRLGGNPDVDVAYMYLKSYFLTSEDAKQLNADYRKGKILSGEMKKMLLDKVQERIDDFQHKYEKVTEGDIEKVIMRNEDVDLKSLIEKSGAFSTRK
ncbi:MAG: tryptophan--tRNA ligase [Candidatus Micrarchaeota archaeon]|nr:tryptophan--tRNA ligase [Candidatus Micrarchaeota archaeon]